MIIWAVANQKGGVGKTTTTSALAAELALRKQRVLCLDIDPHGSLSHYLRIDPDADRASLVDLFDGSQDSLNGLIQSTPWPNVWLATGGARLATLDRHGRQGLGRVLSRVLAEQEDNFDWVLLDCPPTLGVLTINALAACDLLLIPTQTEFLALKGLEGMLRTRDMVARARGNALPCRIIPTLFDGRTRACQRALYEMITAYPDLVWQDAIPTDTKVREAAATGETLLQHAAYSRAAVAYKHLVDDLLTPAGTEQHEVAV